MLCLILCYAAPAFPNHYRRLICLNHLLLPWWRKPAQDNELRNVSTDELEDASITDLADMLQSLGYAIDYLSLGPRYPETSDAIDGLATAVRLLSKVMRNRVTESRSS